LQDQGRALPESERRTHQATIRAALPEAPMRSNSSSTKTDALTATLAQAEQAGHDPKTLLQQAIDMRELDTADDINDVLVWRLRRLAQLPAHPTEATRHPQADTSQPNASINGNCNRMAPAASARRQPDPRNRPPRR
ncbi:mobilization protein, partial [Streptomyces sp. DT225]